MTKCHQTFTEKQIEQRFKSESQMPLARQVIAVQLPVDLDRRVRALPNVSRALRQLIQTHIEELEAMGNRESA